MLELNYSKVNEMGWNKRKQSRPTILQLLKEIRSDWLVIHGTTYNYKLVTELAIDLHFIPHVVTGLPTDCIKIPNCASLIL